MHTAYLVITPLFAIMVTFSGLGKIRGDPRIVKVIHETVGVPLRYFPMLDACEFAGAIGLMPVVAAGAPGLRVLTCKRGISGSIASALPHLHSATKSHSMTMKGKLRKGL